MNSNMDTPTPTVKPKTPPVADSVQAGHGYRAQDAAKRMKVSKRTFASWKRLGMPSYRPPNAKSAYVIGDDVLDFLRQFPEQPETPPPAKPKRKAR